LAPPLAVGESSSQAFGIPEVSSPRRRKHTANPLPTLLALLAVVTVLIAVALMALHKLNIIKF
jgi:hypothetical protein